MALIACRECGKTVSDQALSCPHCGFPLKEDPVLDYAERRVRVGYAISWIIIGLGGLLAIGSLLSRDLRPLAVGSAAIVIMGIVALIGNLVRDYQVSKSKIRLDSFSKRDS